MPTISVIEAAERLNVNRATIERWIKQGLLKATRDIPAGSSPYRIEEADIAQFGPRPPRRKHQSGPTETS